MEGNRTPTDYQSCTLIKIRVRGSVSKIHHRRPAVLKPEVYDTRLDSHHRDTAILKRMLKTDIITEFTSGFKPTLKESRHKQLSLLD
jgi:putative SOS response-associated peptidase YedK